MLIKFFPVVSVWETRPEEPVEVGSSSTAPAGFGPANWGAAYRTSTLILVLLLAGAVAARGQAASHEHHHMAMPAAEATAASPQAQASGPQPSLTITWKALSAVEEPRIEDARTYPAPGSPGRVLAFSKPFPIPWSLPSGGIRDAGIAFPAIQIAAQLRDPKGAPIAFRPVAFALKTLFGSIDYGARPTDDEGKVELTISDRRRGSYRVLASYAGDGQPVRSETLVDFGARPRPGLPSTGVLVGPGFSPEIGLPFICFYGGMWCVFAYCLGYITVYRLRQAQRSIAAPAVPVPDNASVRPEATVRAAVWKDGRQTN
jgi:hypothetical protein